MATSTIQPDAATRVAELGLQEALQKMFDEAPRIFPGLRALEVVYDPQAELRGETSLALEIHWVEPEDSGITLHRKWTNWRINTFPPEVLVGITTAYWPEVAHAGQGFS
jgi:hypothetical protein